MDFGRIIRDFKSLFERDRFGQFGPPAPDEYLSTADLDIVYAERHQHRGSDEVFGESAGILPQR